MGFFSTIKKFFCDLFGIDTKEERKEKQEAKDAEQKPTSDEVKKKKEEKWKDANNPLKFVITKGKVQCTFCSNPIGDFTANYKGVHLQDEDWATTEDCNSKVNFAFTGTCSHPSQQKPFSPPPPCKTVINLGKWKDFSLGVKIIDESPLLMKSTIPCLISGQDLIITDSGQRTSLAETEPMMNKRPDIIGMEWIDKDGKRIKDVCLEKGEAYLRVKTRDYTDKKLQIEFKYKEDEEFFTGEKSMTFEGEIDENGIAILTPVYDNVRFNKKQEETTFS